MLYVDENVVFLRIFLSYMQAAIVRCLENIGEEYDFVKTYRKDRKCLK